MKLSTNEKVRYLAILVLSLGNIMLFQNCSNWQGKVLLHDNVGAMSDAGFNDINLDSPNVAAPIPAVTDVDGNLVDYQPPATSDLDIGAIDGDEGDDNDDNDDNNEIIADDLGLIPDDSVNQDTAGLNNCGKFYKVTRKFEGLKRFDRKTKTIDNENIEASVNSAGIITKRKRFINNDDSKIIVVNFEVTGTSLVCGNFHFTKKVKGNMHLLYGNVVFDTKKPKLYDWTNIFGNLFKP